jgi:hypothetical protein
MSGMSALSTGEFAPTGLSDGLSALHYAGWLIQQFFGRRLLSLVAAGDIPRTRLSLLNVPLMHQPGSGISSQATIGAAILAGIHVILRWPTL